MVIIQELPTIIRELGFLNFIQLQDQHQQDQNGSNELDLLLPPLKTFFENLVVSISNAKAIIDGFKEELLKHGMLNIGKLEKDGLIKIKRFENNNLYTPIKIYEVNQKKILIGQLNASNQLDGVGRRIYIK